MKKEFSVSELKKIYQILSAFDENLIVNPAEQWEQDYYEEKIADKKGLKEIIKKIEKLLPKGEKLEISKKVLRRRYDSFNNEIDERVYAVLEKAFAKLKTVEIEYFNMERAEFDARQIDIYYKSRRYVIGYCHIKKAIRKFRTSRIASAKLTDKIYKIPETFNKNDY